ncbi:hypothetical protein BC828DRAFT_377650 [Blastocladiella britannica]|nr:hypothetical protein BC828DRAFT_377650 [Blastocladiella britannica]
MHWSPDMIKIAVEYGQLGVLEWWSRNWNSLPTQNLECAQSLYNAAKLDAVGVFEWWHARWFPTTTKSDWHNVFWNSIRHNACQVQLWLCDHLDHCLDFDSDRERQVFLKRCMANLTSPRPFTLDFLTTVFGSDLDSQLFKLTHSNLTMTSHANCTLTSRVPLKWGVLEALIRASNLFMLEWWLQVYLAAGVPFVLPPTFERLIATNYKQSVRRWVRDVMVTRKIPVLIQTSVGTVMPYVSQSFPF